MRINFRGAADLEFIQDFGRRVAKRRSKSVLSGELAPG